MMTSYWASRIRRHTALVLAAAIVVWIGFVAAPPPDFRHRLSLSTAYAALIFLAVTLALGPWKLLTRKAASVSFDLRRDLGIWAGILALVHTGVGLTVHLRGRMWMYFFRRLHPLAIQNTQFGAANYIGLVSALVFVLLLVISNDLSLRSLGTRRWKSLQRWTYIAAILAVVHGVLFQLVEKRRLPWVIVFATIIVITAAIQLAGIIYRRRRTQREVS